MVDPTPGSAWTEPQGREVDYEKLAQQAWYYSAKWFGAVLGWTYDRRDLSYSLVLQYWAKMKTKCFAIRKIIRRLLFYTAGFKSKNRGRHWDRKRN